MTRSNKLARLLSASALSMLLLLTGCASVGSDDKSESEQPDKASNTGDPALDYLNQGYSMLYANVSGLTIVDKVFLVKNANQATQDIVGDISSYSDQLAERLEAMTAAYPSVRIDLDPLPEMEKLKQAAAQKQRILSFTPVVGRTGADFERTLLLTLSGGLNQLRFLAGIIAEKERESGRQEIAIDARDQFLELYKRSLKLLNDQYYKHNTYDPEDFAS